MSEVEIPQVDPIVDAPADDDSPIIHPKATPIESRFLYVDVAALRAKQLRRGARPRLDQAEEHPLPLLKAIKAERVAMEEVRQGLVYYDVPAKKSGQPDVDA